MFKVEEELVQDYENFIIPYDLTQTIISNCEQQLLTILDIPQQIYGKALHGDCKVQFKNGNIYTGEFYNGMLHGVGELQWTDGTVYKGEFNYNKIQGDGEYLFKDGSRYKGKILNGLRHGDGEYRLKEDEVIYIGEWNYGLREGQGVLTFRSGAKYEGHFMKGLKNGKGRMTYPSLNYYDGSWENDQKEGYGVMNWKEEKYYGLWKQNIQHCIGTHIWLEYRGEGKYLRNRYEGQWDSGKRDGFGIFYYANGSKYLGNWKQNQKNGFAIFIDENGKSTKAIFKQDRITQFKVKEISNMNQSQEQSHLNQQRQDTKKTMDQKSREIEANPYYQLLNLTDIFDENNKDDQQSMKELFTILLRCNLQLKKIYKQLCLDESADFYNDYNEVDSENSFSLNLYKIYKLFRDCRLFTSKATIAQLNRLFYKGKNNKYLLNLLRVNSVESQQLMKQKMILEAQKMVYVCLMKLNNYEVDEKIEESELYSIIQGCDKEQLETLNEMNEQELEEYIGIMTNSSVGLSSSNGLNSSNGMNSANKNDYDIHNGRIVVLYRHFVELIIRVAVLREDGNKQKIGKKVEDIIVNRLQNYVNESINKKEQQLEEERVLAEKYKEIQGNNQLMQIFMNNSIQGRQRVCSKSDKTIVFKRMIELLQQANLIKSERELKYVVYLLDKYVDTNHCYSDYIQNLQQSMNLTSQKTKISKQERQMLHQKEQELEVQRNLNLQRIMDCELTYMEFVEILIQLSYKKDNKQSKSQSQSIRSIKSNLKVKKGVTSVNENGTQNQQESSNYVNFDGNKLQQMVNDEQIMKYPATDKWKVYIQVFIQMNGIGYQLVDPQKVFKSEKDSAKEQLKEQRERERLEEVERQRKKAELQQEELNRKLLEMEDVNILALEVEDEDDYDSDY